MRRRKHYGTSQHSSMVQFVPNMTRRRLLPLVPALPLAASAAPANTTKSKQQLTISAPGDVTVQKWFVTNGQVKTGDMLATLSSIQLDKYRALLDSHAQLLAIEERPFLDGRVDALVQLAKTEQSAAQEARNAANDYLTQMLNGAILGVITATNETNPARVELQDRISELATITNEVDEWPKRIQDAKDRTAQAKQQLAIQRKALDALAALLNVSAPTNGIFVASIGTGGSVQRGDEMGILYL
jgi:biotin carboxyl carrier protein